MSDSNFTWFFSYLAACTRNSLTFLHASLLASSRHLRLRAVLMVNDPVHLGAHVGILRRPGLAVAGALAFLAAGERHHGRRQHHQQRAGGRRRCTPTLATGPAPSARCRTPCTP